MKVLCAAFIHTEAFTPTFNSDKFTGADAAMEESPAICAQATLVTPDD